MVAGEIVVLSSGVIKATEEEKEVEERVCCRTEAPGARSWHLMMWIDWLRSWRTARRCRRVAGRGVAAFEGDGEGEAVVGKAEK